ncbi:Suppressor protein of bem1/bed5 double mutants [Taphrina deformans PYCC 5710]|uniref:Suppressor protein of bem1/bed5 double mutants n=1 Tax=Taphrina deformans (strain PYCC 5710 / ATCC 11124 / CBS 356.35 / IMI 108563 / JCM 9778 / NBRC 8474) TaxID=1097556 RepID=R4XBI3_TAPDE|nr:Suppressor protein of bem1/bed5 double mutants [Taphrina deformans PYCC 5710]|eukprot:CCG80698.1 Suppressor protein of bem1/bed5 double mutants [Taphrina deformans PYCC 5710]
MDNITKALGLANKAIAADKNEEYDSAYTLYMSSLDWFMIAMKYEKHEGRKQTIRTKTIEYMARAEQIKEMRNTNSGQGKKKEAGVAGALGSATTKKAGGKKGDEDDAEDGETKKLRGALSSAILSETPDVRWEDVAGLEAAKETLKESVILPLRFPKMFTGRRRPWLGILLYGPPGTGKSYLAKAVATEAKSTFFSVSSSDLISKWMGESEKLVKQLFTMARENKPAIIFIDEIDSLCGARGEGESEAARRVKTEFLVQMNGVGNDMSGILVLGATNIPWSLDTAIRRRFERRVYIPLPDTAARARMFELNVGDTPHELTHKDFIRLGEMTEGLTGSDVATAVRDAIMEPVRRINTATHFKWTEHSDGRKLTPCSPGDQGALEMNWMEVDPEQVAEPILTMKDFLKAVKKARPTVNAEDIIKQVEWTQDFGMEG